MENVPAILDTAAFRHLVIDGVDNINTAINDLSGFSIPEYDELALTYYGATNNIATVVYKKSSVIVATLTLTYAVQPPVANDANLVKVVIS